MIFFLNCKSWKWASLKIQTDFFKYTNGVFKVLLQFNGSRWYEETKHDGWPNHKRTVMILTTLERRLSINRTGLRGHFLNLLFMNVVQDHSNGSNTSLCSKCMQNSKTARCSSFRVWRIKGFRWLKHTILQRGREKLAHDRAAAG